MRILFMDDMKDRHDLFEETHPEDEITHVYSHVEAVRAMAALPAFDEAQLDHDLGEGATGYDTAVYIANVLPPEKRPGRVIVHSFNTVGAPRMVSVLHAAGVPAAWLMFKV